MKGFCYLRTAHHPQMTCEEQAKLIRYEAEQNGYGIVKTGCTILDAKLLGMLQKNRPTIQQVLIPFKE